MAALNVIPYPTTVDYVGPECCKLSAIHCDESNESLLEKAKYLQHSLQLRFSSQFTICSPGSGQHACTAITLLVVEQLQQLEQFRWSQEAYELTCGPKGIKITALTPTGVFYGIQTLLQALQSTPEGLVMPYTHVVDGPRFIWRGVLLDVGRHFFPVPFILKLLDLMALYKMNRFHWHLTEDQGWRLDVPSLPRLAEVAAWRGTPLANSNSSSSTTTTASEADAAQTNSKQQQSQQQQPQQQPAQDSQQQQGSQQQPPGTPPAAAAAAASAAAAGICGRAVPSAAAYHGGSYSMDDVAAVVRYAAERCIEVVPEVELPGHCCAALAAYPNLSCTGDVSSVSTHWGIHEDVYCAGSEDVFSFLEVVFDQVVAQFPCQYVHIGGDEVPKVRWEECDKCQARMRQEGLASESELQSWFVRRISNMLAARGRRLIGWDEILEGGLAEGATVMSWRGIVGGIIAAKSGHDVIMTPTSHCYFDYRQAPNACEPGAWYACLPLHVVYHYDPIPGPWPDAAAAPAAAAASAGGSGGKESSSMSHSQPSRSYEEGEEDEGTADSAAAAAGGAAGGSSAGSYEEDTVMEEQEAAAAVTATAATPPSLASPAAAAGGGCGSGSVPATPQAAAAPAQQQQQQAGSRERSPAPLAAAAAAVAAAAATGAAVDTAAAAAAAGPHFPGDPPGVGLASIAAAAAVPTPAAAAAAAAASPAAAAAGGGNSSAGTCVLTPEEAAHILGSQANLWCEYVQDEDTAEYMLLPRLAALAEAVWTPIGNKDWSRFSSTLSDQLPLLQQMGYKYRPLS